MKKFVTFMMVVALMAVAFTTGLTLGHNNDRNYTVTVVEDKRVEILEDQIDEMDAEHTARRILGNDVAEEASIAAGRNGAIDYRMYADGRLVQSGHIPVTDNRTAWGCAEALAHHVQDHFDGVHTITVELT